MALKSSADRYGSVAMAIHWVTALAIIILLWAGFAAANMGDETTRIQLLRVHVVGGVAVLALTLLRIGWWLWADRAPETKSDRPTWQERMSRLVHRLFYLVIIVLGASGIAMMALSGAADVLFGETTGLPDFREYPPRVAHGLAARLLLALAILHVLAALYHQFVRRDGMLSRMLP